MATHHPIVDLPNELLARIFKAANEHSLKEWDHDASSKTIPSLPFPMLVCAVCQLWRQIALNTPDLWSILHVPFFVSGRPRRALIYDPAKFTTIWLDRSKAAPLHVFIRIPNLALAYDLCVSMTAPKVLQNADRLRTLSVTGDTSELLYPNVKGILSLIASEIAFGSVSSTQTLSLRFRGRGNSRVTEDQALLDRDWDLPSIPAFTVQTLELEGIRIHPTSFPHLQSLTLFHLETTYDEFQNIFPSLPHLRKLYLHQLHILLSGPTNPIPITVPNIDFLSLSFHRRPLNSTSPYPATLLRLPNLHTLALDGGSNLPISSCIEPSFASGSSNLQALRLSNFIRFSVDSSSGTTWSDIQLLHSFTSIKSLELLDVRPGNLLKSTSLAAGAVSRQRKRSIGYRAAMSPQLSEMSRTIEAALQMIRINGRPEAPPALVVGQTATASAAVQSKQPVNWPNLEDISIDTIVAEDLINLCHYVSVSPNIRTVRLSRPARRHLSESVKRRASDDSFYSSSFLTERRHEWDIGEEAQDPSSSEGGSAQEWLQSHVQILPFEPGS